MSVFKKSPWLMHYNASSCNGCDIEVVASLTPMYDLERFGIINTGNPKHADILLVTGSVNEKTNIALQNIYSQMPDPKVVVAVGICATSGGIFQDCYNIKGGADKILPVDIYIPGCAARPESIIDGVIKALDILEDKYNKFRVTPKLLESLVIQRADTVNLHDIFNLQKTAYQSEAELYDWAPIAPLKQTYEELRSDFDRQIFIKASLFGTIAGSVRAYMEDGTCHISRLIVNPSFQNMGIGKRLWKTIERYFPKAERYEIYTYHKSARNIYFYKKLGYMVFKNEKREDGVHRVYLEKINKIKA